MAGLQQLEHFVKQATLWDIGQQFQHGAQWLACFTFQFKPQRTQLGCKSNSTNDSNRVFAISRNGVTNHAQNFLLRVLHAAVIVHQILGLRVVVHGIDREISTGGVFVLRTPYVIS